MSLNYLLEFLAVSDEFLLDDVLLFNYQRSNSVVKSIYQIYWMSKTTKPYLNIQTSTMHNNWKGIVYGFKELIHYDLYK